MRSSDAVKLCPTRKKIDISLFFYFFLRHAQKSKDFFPKLHQFQWNLFIFTIKSHFPTYFFYFFLRPESKCKFLFLFFSLRWGTKHPCRSLSTWSQGGFMEAPPHWYMTIHKRRRFIFQIFWFPFLGLAYFTPLEWPLRFNCFAYFWLEYSYQHQVC